MHDTTLPRRRQLYLPHVTRFCGSCDDWNWLQLLSSNLCQLFIVRGQVNAFFVVWKNLQNQIMKVAKATTQNQSLDHATMPKIIVWFGLYQLSVLSHISNSSCHWFKWSLFDQIQTQRYLHFLGDSTCSLWSSFHVSFDQKRLS